MGGKGVAVVKVKPLSGGLDEGRYIDFGSRRDTSGRLPRYDPRGRVVYGALTPFGSWMGQMAVKTLADTIRDAANMRGA